MEEAYDDLDYGEREGFPWEQEERRRRDLERLERTCESLERAMAARLVQMNPVTEE
jgi:hypothetical protein